MATGVTYTTFFEGLPIASTLPNGSADVVYTVPSNFDAEIDFLHLASGAGTNSLNVKIFHAEDSTYTYILRLFTMQNNTSHNVVNGGKIYLHSGDKLVCYKTGGDFDVTVSGRLLYNPART